MTKKIEITIERADGQQDVLDVLALGKYKHMNQKLLNIIAKDTKAAGRGKVLKSVKTYQASNGSEIFKKLNNLNNEGGEGYLSDDMIKSDPEYKTWKETETLYPEY